jgi:hypothetical protein
MAHLACAASADTLLSSCGLATTHEDDTQHLSVPQQTLPLRLRCNAGPGPSICKTSPFAHLLPLAVAGKGNEGLQRWEVLLKRAHAAPGQ